MKKLIAISTVAALAFATPAMAGGMFGGYGHGGGNNGSLVNVDLGNVGVLNNSQFLNNVAVGNGNSVLSGVLSGNTVASGNSTPVLSGIGLFNNNHNSRGPKRGGRRW